MMDRGARQQSVRPSTRLQGGLGALPIRIFHRCDPVGRRTPNVSPNRGPPNPGRGDCHAPRRLRSPILVKSHVSRVRTKGSS